MSGDPFKWDSGQGESTVDGPASAVDGNLPVFDGTTGKKIKDSGSAPHAAVTLDAGAGAILGLTGQQITLDSQAANRILAGPASGADAAPTFRALVQADIPLMDGWMPAGETWTYASAATFTVSGDVRTKYPTGAKIKLTQSAAVKYFYVVSASYSSPTTTITVTGGSDYSLANAAISDNYLSYAQTPTGFPAVFNWAPTFTGYSANPTGGVYRFRVDGRQVTVVVREPNLGTSNAVSLTISAPVVARTLTGATWLVPVSLADNGVTLTTWGRGRIGSGESVFTFGTNPAIDGGFTVTGGKRVSAFQITYEI